MNEEQLLSINYDFVDRTATLTYEPDAEYDITAIVEYVEDASDGRAVRINIFEGEQQMQSLYRKADGDFGGIAVSNKNGV